MSEKRPYSVYVYVSDRRLREGEITSIGVTAVGHKIIRPGDPDYGKYIATPDEEAHSICVYPSNRWFYQADMSPLGIAAGGYKTVKPDDMSYDDYINGNIAVDKDFHLRLE